MGQEVSKAVLSILNGEGMISFINSTFITLIPKKCNTDSVSDFRPINLCNGIYWLVFKVITNRLKPFMHSLISRNQSVFIPR